MLREPPIDAMNLSFGKYHKAKYELYWNSFLKYNVVTSRYSEEAMVEEILSRFPETSQISLVSIIKTDANGRKEVYHKSVNTTKAVVDTKEMIVYKSSISASRFTNTPKSTIGTQCLHAHSREKYKTIPRFVYESFFISQFPDQVSSLKIFKHD